MLPTAFLGIIVSLFVVDAVARTTTSEEVESEYEGQNILEGGLNRSCNMMISYYLYTRNNMDKPEIISNGVNSNTLKERIKYPFKIYSHGFMSSGHDNQAKRFAKDYVKNKDVNVILLDWGMEAHYPLYSLVANETENIGRCLGEMVEYLVAEGAPKENFHLIGFSLGAHIAGFAGKYLQKSFKVPRITGIDPAAPRFEDTVRRLNKNDADFVDIIHTCGGVYGLSEQLGHADFYVNGGMHPQPGCRYLEGSCSHSRGIQIYIESINPENKFRATQCEKKHYKPHCKKNTHYNMGAYVDNSARGMYYVETTKEAPYVSPLK